MADVTSLPFDERAYENYRDEMREIQNISDLLGEKDCSEIEEYREPLSVDERKELTILLSWGGPSDGYKILFDKDNQAIEGQYFFADWFEYKEFKPTDDELDRVITVQPICPQFQLAFAACLPAVRKLALAGGSREAIPEIGGDMYDHHHWEHCLSPVSSLPQLVSG